MPLITPNRHHGFTLIEVLISMLILAIGLLGMAALMMSSLQANQGAALRSTATILTYDIADRMRSNNATAANSANYATLNPATAALPACHGSAAGCGAADQVQQDLFEWSANLQAGLPGSNGIIQRINNNNFCVVIFWTEPAEVGTGTPCGQAAAGRTFVTMNIELIQQDDL